MDQLDFFFLSFFNFFSMLRYKNASEEERQEVLSQEKAVSREKILKEISQEIYR